MANKLPRKSLQHYVKIGTASSYVRIKNPTSLTINNGVSIDTSENIAGEVNRTITQSQEPIEVEGFYDHDGELEKVIMKNGMAKEIGDAKTAGTYVEALFDESLTCLYAFEQPCNIYASEYGGDAGDSITLNYQIVLSGERVEGKFDAQSKTFTKTGA